ncbi:site-specific integrase [Aliarcobacter cryaerophilus]|uniref:tyrosine-type recombinase/integrase n=1 Tax=Aliarcobacter cryaerophilus TaxID=28198 RepID=UPI0021B2B64A|nr:site-specific integrase [Aliarcobacter cryaerophilus]MCT7480362.1 site-specific integrase [Aliarcobacter cryaerophilus]MCT7484758.1 site-specific integrase [Aliarcobacter cryaerophilus]
MKMNQEKSENIQKIDKVIIFFKEALSKHKSLDKDFIAIFLKTIDENKDKIKIIANKIKLDTDFYDLFISHNKLDEESNLQDLVKKDNKYYKNFLKLKKYKIIHKQSSGFYPKNIMLVSTNPNPRSFILSDFSLIDKFDERKKSLEDDLINNNENTLLSIYYYLRYFHLPSFSISELKDIKIEDIFILDENKSFVILYKDTSMIRDVAKDSDKYYETVLFNNIITKALTYIKKYTSGILFQNVENFEELIKKQLRIDFDGSVYNIKLAKENYYIFNNSSLEYNLINKNILSVNLSLAEINTMYPNILDERLLIIEKERIKEASKKVSTLKENKHSRFDISDLIEFMKIMRNSANKNISLEDKADSFNLNKSIDDANIELEFLIKSDESNKIYYAYLMKLLEELKNKNIVISSFRSYVWIINKHIFRTIENIRDIKFNEIQKIIYNLEDSYKLKSKIKIIDRIKHFFNFCGKNDIVKIPIGGMFYPKSFIFKEEIDPILNRIEQNFIEKNQVDRFGRVNKYKLLQKKAFLLIAFYSGLRKEELRTRLFKDINLFGNKLVIDVNTLGPNILKTTLKTKNARRRVETFIDDFQHIKIIEDFLKLRIEIKKNRIIKFLFLDSNKTTILIKPISETYINDISISIKEVVNRYVSFHSLRHSFATYQFKKILEEIDDYPYAMLQLAMMMGHSHYNTTLDSYIHYDFIRLLQNKYLI